MAKKKLLITGGCGFVGLNLIADLVSRGEYFIRVLDNEILGKRQYLEEFPDVEFVAGDICKKDDLRLALKDISTVIHLAADTRVIDSIENPSFNFDVNVCGTFNLLQTMREVGVTNIINASTGGAILGDAVPPVNEAMLAKPLSPYGAGKLAIEGYLSAFSGAYGFNAVSLRFSNIYGERSWHKGSVVAHFFKQILNSNPLKVFGDGSQLRDYVHVSDICCGIREVLDREITGIFQLGSGVPVSINELIEKMKTVVGEDKQIDVEYHSFRDGEILHTWSDITLARKVLRFNPSVSLEDGLTTTWAWFCNSWKEVERQ